MDELALIRDLAEGPALPDRNRLAPARAGLLAATTPATGRRWGGGRIALAGTAGLAAAVVVVVAALQPSPSPAVDNLPLRPASQVLDDAARAALHQETVVPRPDQFLHVVQRGAGGKVVYEAWLSIDGTHDGLVDVPRDGGRTPLPACRPGVKQDTANQCQPEPHYLPDLPSDPAKLLDQLRANATQESPEARTNAIAKDLWNYAETYWLTPAQRAAVYRAAAQVKGLRVVEGVKDPAGRAGTGIVWSYGGSEAMWIFDPRTHRFLGSQTAATDLALVDAVGER